MRCAPPASSNANCTPTTGPCSCSRPGPPRTPATSSSVATPTIGLSRAVSFHSGPRSASHSSPRFRRRRGRRLHLPPLVIIRPPMPTMKTISTFDSIVLLYIVCCWMIVIYVNGFVEKFKLSLLSSVLLNSMIEHWAAFSYKYI